MKNIVLDVELFNEKSVDVSHFDNIVKIRVQRPTAEGCEVCSFIGKNCHSDKGDDLSFKFLIGEVTVISGERSCQFAF